MSHLDRLQEEAAELIKAVAKMRRFGGYAVGTDGTIYENIEDVRSEMIDLYRRMRESAAQLHLSWREISSEGCLPKPWPETDY